MALLRINLKNILRDRTPFNDFEKCKHKCNIKHNYIVFYSQQFYASSTNFQRDQKWVCGLYGMWLRNGRHFVLVIQPWCMHCGFGHSNPQYIHRGFDVAQITTVYIITWACIALLGIQNREMVELVGNYCDASHGYKHLPC